MFFFVQVGGERYTEREICSAKATSAITSSYACMASTPRLTVGVGDCHDTCAFFKERETRTHRESAGLCFYSLASPRVGGKILNSSMICGIELLK